MSIELKQEVLQSIEELADQKNRTPSEVVAEAIQLYRSQKKKKSGYEFLLSIAGQGRSDQHDVSARDEEILESEVDPIRGWRLDDSDHDLTRAFFMR